MVDHIYFIGTPDGHVKIGVSGNPTTRLATLQTGNPHKLSVLYLSPVTAADCDAYKIEKELHRLLAPRRVNGEWFQIDQREIDLAVDLAQYGDITKDEQQIRPGVQT